MVVAATFMVTARLTGIAVRDHWPRPAAVDGAVVSGAGVVGSIVFWVGALIFDVRNLVAYDGITISGAMTASTLTGRRFAAELTVRRSARGRGPVRVQRDGQATADLVRPAVGETLVPALPLIRADIAECGTG
jgi:putative ABC transport system permease protein